jgi:hypothetical protein
MQCFLNKPLPTGMHAPYPGNALHMVCINVGWRQRDVLLDNRDLSAGKDMLSIRATGRLAECNTSIPT